MAGETVITVVGNLTNDPELRFTPSGAAVASFTVASTPRTLDRATNEWKDGEALFLRCSIWRQAAENVAESLHKGARVIVQGRLKQRSFETREGEKRTVIELDVDEIGPSLRYATAKVVKAARGGGGYGGGPGGGGYGGPPPGGGYGGGPAGGGYGDPGAGGGAPGGGAPSGNGGNGGAGYGAGPSGGGYAPAPAGQGSGGYGGGPVDDPWSAPAGSYSDEPPF
jgi:single-strand DNA-binding protein